MESANVIKSDIGSAISFNKNNMGFRFVESLKDFSRLNTYDYMYS